MARYILPDPRPVRLPSADRLEVSGEDVRFVDGLVVSAGDWSTVTGEAAAEQSVRREAVASPGSFLRRPEWGVGATQVVFRGATKSVMDELVTRARRRLLANPRVGRVVSVESQRLTTAQGSSLSISYEPVGVRRPNKVTLKGSR